MLDRQRPFAEIHGWDGIAFEQDGRYFDLAGREAMPPTVEAEDIEEDAAPVSESSEPAPTPAYEVMHWRRLKVLIESFGGTWTNKENALRFLNGDDAA